MLRVIAVLIVTGMLLIFAACPRPIKEGQSGQLAAAPAKKHKPSPTSDEDSAGDRTQQQDGDEESGLTDVETTVGGDSEQAPEPGFRELSGESETADGGPESQQSAEDSENEQPGLSADEETEPAEPEQPEDQLPPGVDLPSFTPDPPDVEVSPEMKEFAGTYQVVSVTRNGVTEQPEQDRIMILSADGSYDGIDFNDLSRPYKRGIWQIEVSTLTVAFGPAGEQSLKISSTDGNLVVFRNEENKLTLFSLKLPQNATAVSPAESYDTDFGDLTLARSGPGYWHGEYGEPKGTLVLQELNGYMFGTWQQGSHEGFIVFDMEGDGFTGYWWYSGQDSVNGHWNGTAKK